MITRPDENRRRPFGWREGGPEEGRGLASGREPWTSRRGGLPSPTRWAPERLSRGLRGPRAQSSPDPSGSLDSNPVFRGAQSRGGRGPCQLPVAAITNPHALRGFETTRPYALKALEVRDPKCGVRPGSSGGCRRDPRAWPFQPRGATHIPGVTGPSSHHCDICHPHHTSLLIKTLVTTLGLSGEPGIIFPPGDP